MDLGELPPAKGFSKTTSALSSDKEGEIVLLQAAEYILSKKHIPDLDAMLCHLFSCPTDQASRKAQDVFSHNCLPEQKN